MKLDTLIYSSCSLICKEIERYIKKEDDKLADFLEKSGYQDVAYTMSKVAELEDKLIDILQGQTDAFITLLENNPNANISEIIDMLPEFNSKSSVASSLKKLFKTEFEETVSQIATSYIQSIDEELELKTMTNRTSDWINNWSVELSDIMEVTSEEKLNNILSDAVKEGKSVSTVAKELTDSGIVESASRARTTALTEMLRANSVAAQEAYIQSPAVSQKRWRHTGAKKNNPRSNHVSINGQIVNVDEPFELIGANGTTYYPMYPRDPILPPSESVNCHCIHQPIVDKDVLGLSLKEREKLQNNCIKIDNKSLKDEKKGLDNATENGIINLKRKANNRKEKNIGAFVNLEIPMQKRSVLKICKKYSVDTKGLTFKIQRSEKLLNLSIYGSTDYDNIGRIDLLPNAFIDEEQLLRTILHEKCHVKQLKKYGKQYVQDNLADMERAAYKFEDVFYNILNKKVMK